MKFVENHETIGMSDAYKFFESIPTLFFFFGVIFLEETSNRMSIFDPYVACD